MKAMVYGEYGRPERVLELAEIDRPALGDDEVLVRVHTAGVNPGDWFLLLGIPYLMRLGSGLTRPKNRVLGIAVAGRVESVGPDVSRIGPGDEVYAETSLGGFAEYVSVPEAAVAVKPSNLTYQQAAAVPVVGTTALQALRDIGQVEPGQHVLITGASGGVGTFAVQIARHFGADVTGVCSTANVDLVTSIGADHVIDYTRDDFTDGPARYDLILDNVGDRSLSACRRALTRNGTLIPNSNRQGRWIGDYLARAAKALAISPFVSQKLRPFAATGKSEDLVALRELIETGEVTPVIDRAFPLADTAEALRHYGQGHTRGNVVVTL